MKLKFELIFFKRKGLDFSRFMEDEDEQLEKSLQKQQKLTLAKLNVEDTVKDFLESNTKKIKDVILSEAEGSSEKNTKSVAEATENDKTKITNDK